MNSIITIDDLSFSYTKNKPQFTNLNLSIPKGSIYGFLGPNGAGKSTLIRIILGLLKPTKGKIELMGLNLDSNKSEILSDIGSLIENPSLYTHLTGYQNLEIANQYKGKIDKEKINELLSVVGLEKAKKQKVKSYSLGMKQRLGIAIALVCNPKILVLDEPINGLDPQGIKEIRTLLKNINKKYNTTVFISSHLLSEIENTCSDIAIINKGNLLYNGTIKDFKSAQQNKIKVKFEVDDSKKALEIIDKEIYPSKLIDENWFSTTFKNKQELSQFLKFLNTSEINLFQSIINDNLEERYLKLIKNN